MNKESFINTKVVYENELQTNYTEIDRSQSSVEGEVWLTYETETWFSHYIKDIIGLVDRDCLSEHVHSKETQGFNPQVIVKVREHPNKGEFIDFKSIKLVTEIVLQENNGFKGKVGKIDAERFASELRKEIAQGLKISLSDVRVILKETQKYGIEII